MGRDKAGMEFEGQIMWRRQLTTLRDLRPKHLWISGPADGPYATSGVEVLTDTVASAGPLAGVERSLVQLQTAWLAVLAIDMPEMKSSFLAKLIAMAQRTRTGIVPVIAGRFEPLAAIYPKSALLTASECLQAEIWSLQVFVRKLIDRELVAALPVAADEVPMFRNINTPSDLE